MVSRPDDACGLCGTGQENCARPHGPAEILPRGGAHGTRLLRNRIVRRPGRPDILVAPGMPLFEDRDNRILPEGEGAIVYQQT